MNKSPLNENEFFGAQAGANGTVNYQTPLNTHSSPDVSQNPNQFAGSNQNKAGGDQLGNVDSGSMAKNLDAIYSKRDVPSPDEVATGFKYELNNMIKKDKAKAKEIVLTNLRKDPHYYGKLHHLNIDDKTMQVNEIKNILEGLTADRAKRFATTKPLSSILSNLWDNKKQRSDWKTKPN